VGRRGRGVRGGRRRGRGGERRRGDYADYGRRLYYNFKLRLLCLLSLDRRTSRSKLKSLLIIFGQRHALPRRPRDLFQPVAPKPDRATGREGARERGRRGRGTESASATAKLLSPRSRSIIIGARERDFRPSRPGRGRIGGGGGEEDGEGKGRCSVRDAERRKSETTMETREGEAGK